MAVRRKRAGIIKKKLIPGIKREYAKALTRERLERLIITQNILRGKSPVKGHGRFKKYSDVYKRLIRGTGRLKSAAGRTSTSGQKLTGKIFKGSDAAFEIFKLKGRQISPVNLKLTRDMLNSFFRRKINRDDVLIGFKDEKADFHNRRGAGKSRVIRRMLPTNPGEDFNVTIRQSLLRLLGAVTRREIRRLR